MAVSFRQFPVRCQRTGTCSRPGVPFDVRSQEMNLAPLGRRIPENFREGFDACVVPTLVDHQAECVVVDSGYQTRLTDGVVSLSRPGYLFAQETARREKLCTLISTR